MIVSFMVVIMKIMNMFGQAYPDLYYNIRWKLWFFLFIYISFLIIRVFNYNYRMLWAEVDSKTSNRDLEILYYMGECVLISSLIYVMYANIKSE